jgi:hypothetical protein
MKKIFVSVLALAMAFAGCNNENSVKPTKDSVKKGTKFMSSIGIQQGKIVVDGDEMSGGAAYIITDNDLLGIEVRKITNGASDPIETELVASGLFKGKPTELKVELEHGEEYIFEATLVHKGVSLSKGTGEKFTIPFTDASDTDRAVTLVTNWTKKQNSDIKSFKSLAVVNLDMHNKISEKDRFYAKITKEADFADPSVEIALRRVSIELKPFVYNVGFNCYVYGEIATESAMADNRPVNFPVQNTETAGIEIIDNLLGGAPVEKTFDIPDGMGGTIPVTANGYTEERYFVLNDITNAYSHIKDNDALSQSKVQLKFYVKAKDDDDLQANDVTLRTLVAEISPEPNKMYNIYVDASTDTENAITITTEDNWVEADPIVTSDLAN